jgi:SAM-dependent methyltransferase
MKLNSDYWEALYKKKETLWDVGEITTPIKTYIDQLEDKTIRILIPGAGNSYEFEYLLQKGFENTFVVDFAKTPLDNIKKRIPQTRPDQLICADFFDLEGSYDLIIEQTFFCALDPELREKYVQKMKSLLNPNGKIIGLLFQFPLSEKGPPFGGSISEYQHLFETDFTINLLEKAHNSIKPRKENELFFIFKKK